MTSIVLLDKKKHNRKSFDCGIPSLNVFLKQQAGQQSKRDNSTTCVLESTEDERTIAGFYTLSMTQIDLSLLPADLQKKHFKATSCGLIARLAVDQRYQGRGYGEILLINALHRNIEACKWIAYPVVVVDAKEGAREFYIKYGFKECADDKDRLYLSMETLRDIQFEISR